MPLFIDKNIANSNELDGLITAFTSPIPNNILVDYDKKPRKKREPGHEGEDMQELKGP